MEHNQAVERLKQEIIADTGRILQGLPQGDASRFTVLIENFKPAGSDLKTTHGLSIYLERAGRSYLLDTGTGASTFENAAALGKDIAAVEAVFISHGHFDHGGGLARFLEINGRAQISQAKRRSGRHLPKKTGRSIKTSPLTQPCMSAPAGFTSWIGLRNSGRPDRHSAIEQLFPLRRNANLYRETGHG